MAPERTIALAFDPERADFAQRETVRGIARFAREKTDWRCVLDPLAARHLPGGYAGVMGPATTRMANACADAGVPFVATTRYGGHTKIPQVTPGYAQAGRLAGEHLRDCEYDHFAYLGYHRLHSATRLEEGFARAVRPHGRSLRLFEFAGARTVPRPQCTERLLEAIDRWLGDQQLPAGILACNDALARMVHERLVRRGLRVPEDVGLVGAGNDPMLCSAPWPPLTSVDLRLDAVGYRAAGLLDRLLAGKPRPTCAVTVAPRVVARDSTNRQLDDDPLVARALEHIARHCQGPLRVDDVAAAVGVSARALLRRFQKARHHSVRHAILLARLALARDLLATSDVAVGEVARSVGFPTPDRMREAFRKHLGLTPGAWRREQPPAPAPSAPLERAKQLLANTNYDIRSIALLTGFRTHATLRSAFRRQEGTTPGAWRAEHRRRRPGHTGDGAAVPVEIVFIGPDGQPEPWPDEERGGNLS